MKRYKRKLESNITQIAINYCKSIKKKKVNYTVLNEIKAIMASAIFKNLENEAVFRYLDMVAFYVRDALSAKRYKIEPNTMEEIIDKANAMAKFKKINFKV